jgi:signal transduction histidine kinase
MVDTLRILMFLANPANTSVASLLLAKKELDHVICTEPNQLLEEAAAGVGVLLLEEERLRLHHRELTAFLDSLPPWSEPPVILLTGRRHQAVERILVEQFRNITLLERPISSLSLISHLHAGRRARKRQYQMRDLLAELRQINQGLEQEVAERTAEAERRRLEAERSNEELQHFASTISHDLRQPLLVICRYLHLLEKRSGDRLDATSRDFVSHMIASADRLQAMISGVLNYSSIGRQSLKPEIVDAAEVVALACDHLETAITETGAAITHDRPLPRLRADKIQLTQLLQNLISNGLKFVRDDRPRIHISAEQRPGAWQFRVTDNGIGIDPAQHQAIFRLFDRAHDQNGYAGTGIGLAVCKQIVERHGGSIWVESAPGEGASFCFTLPDSQAAG